MRRKMQSEEIKKAEFQARSIGLGLVEHNYMCATCFQNSAVYYTNKNILLPCWGCMEMGYYIVRVNKFSKWILTKLGIIL